MTRSSEETQKSVLRLPEGLRRRLEDIVREGYPRETCGTLIGRSTDAGTDVCRVEEGQNLNAERAQDRYELDPGHLLWAETRAREDGLEVVGIWHSHPDHPARPSETDRSAAWEGWSYLVASVGAEAVHDIRSWRLKDSVFHEEEIRP